MRDDAPYGLDDPQHNPGDEVARRRVRPPAILMLIVGVLNLLCGLFFMVRSISVKQEGMPTNFKQVWEDMDPEARDNLVQNGWSPESLFFALINSVLVYGGVASLVSVISVFGAIRMMSLHSYGLAMFGAILTAIPCVTPCCLIGQVAGVWAILILLNPAVRKAFR